MLRTAATSPAKNDSIRPAEPSPAASGGPAPEVLTTPPSTSQAAKPDSTWSAHVAPWIMSEIRFHSILDFAAQDNTATEIFAREGFEAHAARGPELPRVSHPDGYFDLVLCAENLDSVDPRRLPVWLSEIDRLSNSYIVLVVESDESSGATGRHNAAWWCQKAADFGWRLRYVREDAETGRIAIFGEKPDSLAAQVLPRLDAEKRLLLDQNAKDKPLIQKGLTATGEIVNQLIQMFRSGRTRDGVLALAQLADQVESLKPPRAELNTSLRRLVEALERRDFDGVLRVLETELRPQVT